jgi:hypothetical protein
MLSSGGAMLTSDPMTVGVYRQRYGYNVVLALIPGGYGYARAARIAEPLIDAGWTPGQ